MASWDSLVAFAITLPETEESTWYGTPALKEKVALLSSGDDAFYTTAHYDGYGSILVNLEVVDEIQVKELVTEAWRLKAPASLRKAFDS